MKRKIIFLLLFALCISMLASCSGDKTVEYGYDLLQASAEEYVSYRLGYKVEESIMLDKRRELLFELRLSHGTGGPWYGGGFVYPEVKRIEVVFEDEILCKDEYFDYLDSYYYASGVIEHTPSYLESTYGNKRVELYTSEKYDGNPNSFVRFNNEEEYLLRLSEDKEEYTFRIREVYFDGSVKVVCEAKLYARFDGDTVHFSAEPFDEAE